ncbi:hypothetical protein LPJ70_002495 [Coemansia sp. RSA 2708]|nr:hypothetical protein LPJ70_002495 [Coemansia sp. RSA 2708]KAJ2364468.1 hypothetical protein H4S01_003765 [Coemansia sp. RSA 2610]
MGILRRIKNSYVFTQLEVGKYTKRRTSANQAELGVVRAVYEDEFDRAANELRAEQLAEEHRKRSAQSAETLAVGSAHGVARVRSSMDLTAAQRQRLDGRTAVSTPATSPDAYEVRARPRPTRTARSNADMQSVYFAPGRNVSMTNQQKQRQSVYPTEELPSFDKNSASSTDYYVYAPSARQRAQTPLDARRRQMRGQIRAQPLSAGELHRSEELAEPQTTNPFVERRRKAHKMVEQGWNSAAPFDDPLVGSGRGGIDPNHPRKHLNTPVYANQAGTVGLDLLA